MTSQIIVELNQSDTQNSLIYDDGDYNVTLKKPVILNKGDQLQLKSAFIDTRVANSQKIHLKGDMGVDGKESNETTIRISFGYYKTDVRGSFEDEVSTTTYEGANPYAGNYYNLYTGRAFPAFKLVNDPTNNALDVLSFTIKYTGDNYNNVALNLRNADDSHSVVSFTFKSGFTKTYSRYIERDEANSFDILTINEERLREFNSNNSIFSSISRTFPIVVKKPSGTETIKSLYLDMNPELIGMNTTPHTAGTGGTRQLYTDQIEFKLDAGFYDADAIAEIINKKCSKIRFDGDLSIKSYEISRNPLLKTIQQVRYDEGLELSFVDIDETNVRQFKYATGDGVNTGNLKNLLNYYIGSSQFGLSYNQNNRKMEFLQLHNSLYSSKFNSKDASVEKRGTAVDTTSAPEVRLLKNENGNPLFDTKYIVNKNCGIFFTNLEPKSLWFDEFKFDPHILVGQQTITKTFHTDGQVKLIAPSKLQDGINITADDSGLDEMINKTINVNVDNTPSYINGTFQAFDIATPVLEITADNPNGGQIFANTTQTLSIIAEEQIGESLEDEGGYFKVEIGMNGVLSDVRGFGENRRIQSIISKYYSQASYTSAYDEGSIAYQHNNDEPLVISDLHVRILDPNNQLSKSVGNKNAVFLEIIKNS